MNASSSSDDDDAPGASTWEGEDETSEASGDSDAAGERARRVEAAATKRLSLSERLRRLDAAAAAAPPQPPPPPRGVKTKRRRRDAATPPGRASKNAPAEASSRRRPPAPRRLGADAQRRDPRFDALSTGGDAAAATRRYAFLAEREKEELKASRAYLKTKRGRRDAAARGDYERRVSKQRQREHDERRRAVTARFRREERSKVKKTGKAPYYAKRSVLKGAVAQDRFADLKNRGKLGAFLAKRGRRAGLLEKGARKQGNDPTR